MTREARIIDDAYRAFLSNKIPIASDIIQVSRLVRTYIPDRSILRDFSLRNARSILLHTFVCAAFVLISWRFYLLHTFSPVARENFTPKIRRVSLSEMDIEFTFKVVNR